MSRPKIGDLIPIGGGGYSLLSNITDFKASRESENSVRLYWRDPDDVIVDGNIITKWAGTQIRRKVGNYPVNEKDGELVVDSKIRNQYSTTPFVDSGLDKDTEYYYMAFPYTDKNVFTVDSANRVVLLPTVFYYSHGDECPNVTGGWIGNVSEGARNKRPKATKEESHLFITNGYASSGETLTAWATFRTNNTINLNGLNKIEIEWGSYARRGDQSYLSIFLSESPNDSGVDPLSKGLPHIMVTPSSGEEYVWDDNFLDVSTLSGDYYLYFQIRSHASGQEAFAKLSSLKGDV